MKIKVYMQILYFYIYSLVLHLPYLLFWETAVHIIYSEFAGDTPFNAGQVLKEMLLQRGVELQSNNFVMIGRKKRRYDNILYNQHTIFALNSTDWYQKCGASKHASSRLLLLFKLINYPMLLMLLLTKYPCQSNIIW